MTQNGFGSLTSLEDVNMSRFQSQSPLLHQLVIPVATVNDTGNYTCIVRAFLNTVIIFKQTISLTVTPGNNSYEFNCSICTDIF